MKQSLLIATLLLASITASAQTPQLVDNIISGSAGGDPQRLTVFNNKLVFSAKTPAEGRELWSWHTMGTPAAQVSDYWTGVYDGAPGGVGAFPMHVYKGKLYFFGKSAANQNSLMAYDGINPPRVVYTKSTTHSGPIGMVTYGNCMYFVDDSRLYRYYGTGSPVDVGRTHLVAGNWPHVLQPYKGKIYYCLDSAGMGSELGAYDTLTGSAGIVASFTPGPTNSTPRQFLVYGDKMYFVATDSTKGDELWSFDGTTFRCVTDIMPGGADGATFTIGMGTMAAFRGSIYLSARTSPNHHALFRYDTASGLATLAYDPAPGLTVNGNPACIYATQNNVYFYYAHPTTGSELYQYNGYAGKLVADLNPGKASGAGFSIMTTMGNYLYFCGENPESGRELYRLNDGEYNGIERVAWSGKVTLYPNPAGESAFLSITLQRTERLSVSLTNIRGQEVFSHRDKSFAAGRSEITLSLDGLAAGLYFYQVIGEVGGVVAAGDLVKR